MAEVAGPGRYAKRTDLVASGGEYGERKATEDLMASAPMAQAPAPPRPTMTLAGPTTRPNEPITAGAAFGAGPGNDVLPMPPQAPDETATLIRQLATIYPDPDLLRLVQRLSAEGR